MREIRNTRYVIREIVSSTFLFLFAAFVLAADFSSTDYTVSAPVLNSGEYSTSTDYQLFGSISQIATGTSTATGYEVRSGFLYFPVVSVPTVTATAGNGSVTLSWTAAVGAQGWVVSSYNVGQSTAAGGPHTYTDVGNVTSSSRTGLTNGTTYYFVVRPEDAFNNSLATSTEVSATPQGSGDTGGGTGSSSSGGKSSGIFEAMSSIVKDIIASITEDGARRSGIGGDLNYDGRVDLIDFSILAYWYQKPNPPAHIDLSKNGIVELADFSIVSFYWTDPPPLRQHIVRGGALSDETYTVLFAAPQDKVSFVFHKPVEEKLRQRLAAELPSAVNKPFWWVWIIAGFIMASGAILWRYRFRIKSIF